MPDSRLPSESYKMLHSMHCNNKNWLSSVCLALYRCGFGYVWENQGVNDVKALMLVYFDRVVDCYLQEWNADISSRDRFAFLSSTKQTYCISQYLLNVRQVVHKTKILTRFRLGVSPLYPHRLRFSENNRDSFDCSFRKRTYESEFHFLLVCPKYKTLRESFLPTKFYNHPTAFKMSILLVNYGCAPSLAAYTFKAFELRSALLTSAHQAP